MKKILLIIAIVLCVAIAATAFAVQYQSANTNKTGTLTADSYLELGFDEDLTSALNLTAGQVEELTIGLKVDKSSTAPNAVLNVTFTGTTTGLDFHLYTDANHMQEVTVNQDGSYTIGNLTEDTPVYVTFYVSDDNAATLNASMTLSLTEAA